MTATKTKRVKTLQTGRTSVVRACECECSVRVACECACACVCVCGHTYWWNGQHISSKFIQSLISEEVHILCFLCEHAIHHHLFHDTCSVKLSFWCTWDLMWCACCSACWNTHRMRDSCVHACCCCRVVAKGDVHKRRARLFLNFSFSHSHTRTTQTTQTWANTHN